MAIGLAVRVQKAKQRFERCGVVLHRKTGLWLVEGQESSQVLVRGSPTGCATAVKEDQASRSTHARRREHAAYPLMDHSHSVWVELVRRGKVLKRGEHEDH